MRIKNILLGFIVCSIIFTSCKKEKTDGSDQSSTSAPVVTHQFLPQSSDPYSGPMPVGGRSYMLLKSPIASNNSFNYYPVYVNRASGDEIGADGNIYYNPITKRDSLAFGSNVYGNTATLRTNANAMIQSSGYVLLASSADGGPAYKQYEIINVPGNVKF